VKIGISAINKFYRTSAINGIIRFIEILSPIKFSLVAGRQEADNSKLAEPTSSIKQEHGAGTKQKVRTPRHPRRAIPANGKRTQDRGEYARICSNYRGNYVREEHTGVYK
jgi:hypothetical protein